MTAFITSLEDFEREFRKGIGVQIDLNPQRYLLEATRDNILNFAEAVGDNNPLWINEDYARSGPFGTLVAPPTFIYNINHGSIPAQSGTVKAQTLGISLLYAGAELEFFESIRRGDSFTVVGEPLSASGKASKALGQLLFTTGEARFFNQRQEKVGLIRTTICRYATPDRQAVEFERKAKPQSPMEPPDALAYDRIRQGSQVRYWEDVAIGDEIVPLKKGVLTMTEVFRFGILSPPSLRRIEVRRENLELGFGRESQQKRAGLEGASDYGPQRICWLGQVVTDWMGDAGILRKLSGQIRHPSIVGDSNIVKGKVSEKYQLGGEHLVSCDIWVENQSGLVTAPGKATVALPSKEGSAR